MSTNLTPSEVRAFLEGGAQPQGVIDAENTWPRPDNPLPMPVGERTARERAALRGWSIDPELTPGNPHALNACPCRKRRLADAEPNAAVFFQHCECSCHGRTFVHYKRGA